MLIVKKLAKQLEIDSQGNEEEVEEDNDDFKEYFFMNYVILLFLNLFCSFVLLNELCIFISITFYVFYLNMGI